MAWARAAGQEATQGLADTATAAAAAAEDSVGAPEVAAEKAAGGK